MVTFHIRGLLKLQPAFRYISKFRSDLLPHSPACATNKCSIPAGSQVLNCRFYSLPVRMTSARLRANADDIFKAAVASVLPQAMVAHALKRDGDWLTIADRKYSLKQNVHVVAFGKAVIGMVRAADDILGDHIVDGIASVPWSIQDTMKNLGKWELLPLANSKVRIIEGGVHNLPDANSHRAANEIYSLLETMTENDLVLALISGGGSALLPSPIPPITIEELVSVTQMMARNGANIQQLNTVRKHLELLKGGGLAKVAHPSQVIALIISDVVGNDLEFISSGPTVPDFTTPRQCLDLFDALGITDKVPRSIMDFLQAKAKLPEFMKDVVGHGESVDYEQIVPKNQPSFHCNNAQNAIIGSNEIALQAAARAARDAGFSDFILSSEIVGDADEIGAMFARFAEYICRALRCGRGADNALVAAELELIQRGIPKKTLTALCHVIEESAHVGRPICLLAAGETTVNVRGKGTGGRCQQMALSAAIAMDKIFTAGSDIQHENAVVFLTAGTDGQDGPTDSAGAVVDAGVVSRALRSGAGDPVQVAADNDAYNFFSKFEKGRNLLKTGLTGTNVMDLHILLVEKCEAVSSSY